MVELLLESRDEERLIKVVHENSWMLDHIDVAYLFRHNLYKLFILFDPMNLIILFNKPVGSEDKEYTLYHKLCDLIDDESYRDGVESICNIIIHVSETFWDMEKFLRFF